MRTGMIVGVILLCMGGGDRAVAAFRQAAPIFQESGGMVVIEAESCPPTDTWTAETSHAGYTGTSYYAWRGPDMPPTGWGASGVLSYMFNVTTPGQYVVRLHCYGELDMYKSVFFKMDSDQSFSTPDHDGWVEYFVNAVNQWSWDTRMVAFDGATWSDVAPVVTLAAGVHTLQLSGREAAFCFDRISIFLSSIPEATAEDLTLPQSPTNGVAVNPVNPNPPPPRPKHATGSGDATQCGCGSISAGPAWGVPLIASILGVVVAGPRRRGRSANRGMEQP